MALLDGSASPKRGTKRKHPGGEATLTALPHHESAPEAGTIASQDRSNSLPVQSRNANGWDAFSVQLGNQDQASDSFDVREPTPSRDDDDYYRKLYTTELDFHTLGERDGDFGAVLEQGSHLDFTDPASVMQLTKTLLKLDFGLSIELPPDRLCPPVPNRHNYILWLKDLVDSSSTSYMDQYEPGRQVTGLDIGTGASSIYPLLGCAQRPWSFVATDIDATSLDYARKNVKLNELSSRVRIIGRAITDPLIPLDDLSLGALDFVMTNPPFYTSDAELFDLASRKSRPPSSACTGAPTEMVCEGGEIGFVQRIMDESLVLRRRVQWYTSMLGKQSSLEVLVCLLREHGISNYAVTAFIQGNKTRRWAVGWSFGSRRPSLSASRGFEPLAGKKMLPHLTEIEVALVPRSGMTRIDAERSICDLMENLDLVSWRWDERRSRGVGFADGNVWSRAYRRRKTREQMPRTSGLEEAAVKDGPGSEQTPSRDRQQGVAQCAFGFAISLRIRGEMSNVGEGAALGLRWLQGDDYGLFESFAGVLRNSIWKVTPERGPQVPPGRRL